MGGRGAGQGDDESRADGGRTWKVLALSVGIPGAIFASVGLYRLVTAEDPTSRPIFEPTVPADAVTRPGDCVAASNATTRIDALRCGFADTLIDPCFKPGQDASTPVDVVVCPQGNPDEDEPIYLAVPGAVGLQGDDGKATTDRVPWLLELEDGAICPAATGMGAFVGNDRINWVCNDGQLVLGIVSRDEDRWTVMSKKEESKVSAERVEVERAWF